MDKDIKNSIDARRNAMFDTYIVEEAQKKKIEALFAEIEKLGASCKNSMDFETEFAKSPLNQKYLDLFTEIATTSKPKVEAPKASMGEVGKTIVSGTAIGVAESAANQAINSIVPTRAAVHQKIHDDVQKVPVLGDAIDLGQKASYAAHIGSLFRKKKKENKE